MIQHSEPIPYDENGDDNERATWMLSLIDGSPDHLAVVPIPRTRTEAQFDDIEARMIRAFDLAKEQRPDLAVKFLPPLADLMPAGQNASATALLMVLHEHAFVGGECVRGCGQVAA